MAEFLQFPRQGYFRLFKLAETEVKGGTFQVPAALDLMHIMATIYIKGTLGGSERMRVNIYGDDTSATPIMSSSWASLSAIGVSANWLGNLYFDFAGQPLNPNIVYFMRVEIEHYTRNGTTFYIALNLDWLADVNTYANASNRGFRVRILGKS